MQGSRALREGRLGLFALLGLFVFGALTIWLRGGGFGRPTYQLILEFPDVGGLQVGAAIRYRGVRVGRIVGFVPGSNQIEVLAEIDSTDLLIPRNVRIETNRSGLIGESAIDITPLADLPPAAKNLNPLAPDCDQQIILCNNARLQGSTGADLFSSFGRLVDTYTSPEFVGNLNEATRSASLAARRLANLSDTTSLAIQKSQQELSRLSRELANTSRSVIDTASNASRFVKTLDNTVLDNRAQITRTLENSSRLTENLNLLLVENRGQIATTLTDIDRAGQGLATLAANLNKTTVTFNTGLEAIDTRKIMQNLDTLFANAAETSNNLREVTQALNDPATIATLQQTLESARVTLENAAKITSDVEEFIGDPKFRQNLRRLVDGLGNLVSSTEQLQYQLRVARSLDLVTREIVTLPLDPSRMQLDTPEIVGKPRAIEPTREPEK
jgi:phospholipid/cholesterol/gamma-HCH transport system substrate-binding protein